MMRRSVWLRVALGLAVSTFAGACASTGGPRVVAVPRPFPVPGTPGTLGTQGRARVERPAPPTAAPEDALDSYALVGTALSLRGAPYRNGGADPSGFDCSGFTQFVFAQYGVALPREVRDQFQQGESVKDRELAAGDLLFFTTVAPGPTHVGIAIGGDQFVHAPSSTGVVRVERLSSSYWSPRYLGARRVSARLESRALP
ncbi:MAG TPA: C40 family peptidase [Vicinamibacterales bacterium]